MRMWLNIKRKVKILAHKLTVTGTYLGLWQRDRGSRGARDIKGKSELCGLEVRAGGTAAMVPVLSLPPLLRMDDAIFPVLSSPNKEQI